VLKVLSAEAVRDLDRRAAEAGVHALLLMESAGRGAAEEIRRWRPDLACGRVLAVCGKGGNGGDALSALRWLGLWGAEVHAVLLGEPQGEALAQARAFAASFPGRSRQVRTAKELRQAISAVGEVDLVLDGILGLGVRGPAEGLARRAIEELNRGGFPTVALDLPSGLIADRGGVPGPAVRAQLTLAMGALKPCHLLPPAAELCGEVRLVPVAYPPPLWAEAPALAWMVDSAHCARLLPPRPRFGHKGTFGQVLVVGGAVGMAGAVALAAEAALRAGAGLVHVLTPEPVFPIVAGLVPEALVHPGKSTNGMFSPAAAEEALNWAQGAEVVVLGPGLGRGEGPQRVVEALWESEITRLVVDADGLFALAQNRKLLGSRRGETVLTPHPGEFQRLVGVPTQEVLAEKIRWAREKAQEWKCVVVLKGPPTAVADPEGQVFLNTTGNTVLAHGGSGDVLAGLIGGLWAGGTSPVDAACLAAFVHGRAAELASAGSSERALLPRHVLHSLPQAFATLETAQ